MIPTEFSVQTSAEKQRKKTREKKEGKTEKYRREQQNRSSVFNMNPKSTGLLKHKRLGSSSAFCHFSNMV